MNSHTIHGASRKKKVLVIDDDPGILDALQIMLEESGYDVEASQDGVILQNGLLPLPDVILLDIWMSGVNGRDVCKHLKSQRETRAIPVIMMSANKDTAEIAEESGADDFITKPFQMKDLLAILAKYA
jgi:DNA-binding response OmpR family regulator